MEEYVYIDGKRYKRGYTTGSCAAAAAKAAALIALNKEPIDSITIDTPKGITLNLIVDNAQLIDNKGVASVKKDGGDDIDATHKLDIYARVELNNSGAIKIDGGIGVGRITKKGLNIPIGEAAINKVPKEMIEREVTQVIGSLGADIEIYIPNGEEIAKKTFNPRLGIVGGISIIGTTGIVEPMSEEGWKKSLSIELNMKKEQGHDKIILVPGNHGEKYITDRGIDIKNVVRTSNFVGYMLNEAKRMNYKRILLAGHLGKFVKLAGGIFHTHSKVADCRMEILITQLALMGADNEILKEIYQCTTTEAAMEIIEHRGYNQVYNNIAQLGKEKCDMHIMDEQVEIEVIIFSMDGTTLGSSTNATKLLEVFK